MNLEGEEPSCYHGRISVFFTVKTPDADQSLDPRAQKHLDLNSGSGKFRSLTIAICYWHNCRKHS